MPGPEKTLGRKSKLNTQILVCNQNDLPEKSHGKNTVF